MNLLSYKKFLNRVFRAPQQIMSVSWSDRDVILNENVNLFCWERPVDMIITNYLEHLLNEELKTIQFHTDLMKLNDHLEEARMEWGQQLVSGADLFWQDVSRLARDFLFSFGRESATIRLEVVVGDACTQFHTDGYSLRLFTTYYGVGTEWLPERATNRNGLGRSNEQIVKDQSQIRRMNPFDVGILKGEVPGSRSIIKGIVHRSPEIVKLGTKRVTLRVDI